MKHNAARLAGIVRSHWSVENSRHWRLDVQWGEDQCRARSGKAATNLSALRKLAMNLLRAVPPPVRKPASVSMQAALHRHHQSQLPRRSARALCKLSVSASALTALLDMD
ncbi:MAG: transposase [Verrucomicrobiaceae bacterium]|nr:transposase [Verrucomicrobiaceae bacterium]